MHAAPDRPSAWVERFAAAIPAGEVLDLACGSGRHARLLASLGHRVLAVDRDAEALTRAAGPQIVTCQLDLERDDFIWSFEPARFAGIIVTNYLHRPLLPALLESLAPHGVLIYETFAAGNEYFGKPSNPQFLLKRGELLDIAKRLHVVAYEDGCIALPKQAVVQRICAVNGTPSDVNALLTI